MLRGRRLAWSRLVASGAIDEDSNSSGPTKLPLNSLKLELFCIEGDEFLLIKYFKWFLKVLLKLNPDSLDLSTNSLSRYKRQHYFYFQIAFASEGRRREEACY
jgi:hypothetical protein